MHLADHPSNATAGYAAIAAMGLAFHLTEYGVDRLGLCEAAPCRNAYLDTSTHRLVRWFVPGSRPRLPHARDDGLYDDRGDARPDRRRRTPPYPTRRSAGPLMPARRHSSDYTMGQCGKCRFEVAPTLTVGGLSDVRGDGRGRHPPQERPRPSRGTGRAAARTTYSARGAFSVTPQRVTA
ncbi:hypothetical protein SVIOM74S_06317 [Streptomyces violarus]